jgi:hypothetical protein
VLVVVVWIGMVAALVHKQAPQQSTPLTQLADLPAVSPEREEWFRSSRAARRSATRTASSPDGRRLRSTRTELTLAMLGTVQNLQTTLPPRPTPRTLRASASA